jgi:hypothetical protein
MAVCFFSMKSLKTCGSMLQYKYRREGVVAVVYLEGQRSSLIAD